MGSVTLVKERIHFFFIYKVLIICNQSCKYNVVCIFVNNTVIMFRFIERRRGDKTVPC